jgi:hypothetical protein
MAAPENAIVGVDMKLQYDSTLIGTQTDGSLSVSPDLRDIILKNTGGGTPTDWKGRLSGQREWEVSHEGLVLNGSDEYKISTGNAKLELEVDTTDDATDNPTVIEVPRLDSIDFTLTQELAETGGLDRALWRYIRPAEREFSIDISGSYVDPNSSLGEVYDPVLDRLLGSNTKIPATLTVLGKTFDGDVLVGDYSLDASTGGEDATVEMTLSSKGSLTTSGTAFGTGVENIFDAYMNQNSVSVGLIHYDGAGSPNTGSTKYTGSGYFSEVGISIADGEEITCSTSVAGDGPLSRSTS